MNSEHGVQPRSNRMVPALLIALALLSFGDARAKTLHALYSFCSQPNCADGSTPDAALTADSEGNLYGTTLGGGAQGKGTIFRLAPDGTETVLHSFTGQSDGGSPAGSLILDAEGNLYGTAGGGAHGQGVVFKLAPDGTETVLYAFQGGEDGGPPVGSLILDQEGNLFGVGYGGLQECFGGCGAILKLTPDGTESVLYAFCAQSNCEDGELPNGDLVADGAGNLYGTTQGGGGHGVVAAGTVFKVTKRGKETVLWSFCSKPSCSDGEFPLAGVIRDKAGNLYGTTDYGGAPVGTIFKLAPHGTETILYGFNSGSDGGNPATRLAMDKEGDLYGTTSEYGDKCGGRGGCGTIYKLAPSGDLSVLHAIGRGNSSASALIDNRGKLYGTTRAGGAQNAGTVFRVTK